MEAATTPLRRCSVCGDEFAAHDVVSGAAVRDSVAALIRNDHPDWSEDSYICGEDLSRYRARWVEALQGIPDQAVKTLLAGLRHARNVAQHRAAVVGQVFQVEHLGPFSRQGL